MTLAQALARAAAAGLDRLDAQLLLLQVLGRAGAGRAWLLAHDDQPIEAWQAAAFDALCARRLDGEPVAYLLGEREFHGLPLQVDARVLVPRPDTETLVDWALDLLPADSAAEVADLGTGSGAIALALLKARPALRMLAVDASADALAVAAANARRLGLPLHTHQGDWLAGLDGPYDLLVSNPPYIAEGDPHLPALRHEPLSALVSGVDGLDAIRTLVGQAPSRLRPGGWLLLEHGWDQAAAVRQLLGQAGFTDMASRKDLAGIERCTGGRRPEGG